MALAQVIQGFWGRDSSATPEAPWRYTVYAVAEPDAKPSVGDDWYLPNGIRGTVEQVQSRSTQAASTMVLKLDLPLSEYPLHGKDQPKVSPMDKLSGTVLISTDKSWTGSIEESQRAIAAKLKSIAASVRRIKEGVQDVFGDDAHTVEGRKPSKGLPWWVYALGAYALSQ